MFLEGTDQLNLNYFKRGNKMALKIKTMVLEGLKGTECETNIKNAVSKINGVKSVKVSALTGLTEVEFDSNVTSVNEISKVIKSLNYSVFGASGVSEKSKKASSNKKSKKVSNQKHVQPPKNSSMKIAAIVGSIVAAVIVVVVLFSGTGNSSANYVNAATVEGDVQKVTTSLAYGYEPITVQAGVPVEWIIIAEEGTLTSCNSTLVIPEYGIEQELQTGENVIMFTPTEEGTIGYSCWMNMIQSEIVVVDELEAE